MAYINKEKLIKSKKNVGIKKHDIVQGNYYLFTTSEGEEILQINTYGKKDRQKKDKVSQILQVNK